MSKEARNKLRAECPRPVAPQKVCETPTVEPKISQFLNKSGWNPRKGLESALLACQDKHLDIFGPLTRLFEMAKNAKASGQPLDPNDSSGWIQRAICIAGNVNSSFSIE